MKIAILAPIVESVPPKMYGGTELVVYNLVEGLKALGHEVTLFASGDSKVSAKLIPVAKKSVRMAEKIKWPMDFYIYQTLAAEKSLNYILASDFDIVHSHIDYYGLHMSRHLKMPFLATFHGRLDLMFMKEYYSLFNGTSGYISISKNQKLALPDLNWVGTVYNGIDLDLYPYNANPKGNYLLYFSRINDSKGPVEAIKVAKKLGKKLIMASKVDPADEDYYKKIIKPLLSGKDVDYVGEVMHEDKVKLFQDAYAYLFPIKWPEPFGLTMVESLSCGTPVLAFREGSVPEIVKDGYCGYVSSNVDEMSKHVGEIDKIDRENCRKRASLFSKERMVKSYVEVYEKSLVLK